MTPETRSFRRLREPVVPGYSTRERGDSGNPEFQLTPRTRSHPEPGTTGSRIRPELRVPGVTRNNGFSYSPQVPWVTRISGFPESPGYIYINYLRNNIGYCQFMRNKLHVRNKFHTSTVKLRITLRHNKYGLCAHGAVCVTLVPHLLTPVRRNRKYVPLLRRRCLQMSLVHISLLPKEVTRQCSKPRGSKRSPILTWATFIPEWNSNLLTFSQVFELRHIFLWTSLSLHYSFFPALWPWNIKRYVRGQRNLLLFLWIRALKMPVDGQWKINI